MLASPFVRAHQHAATGKGAGKDQALRRSRSSGRTESRRGTRRQIYVGNYLRDRFAVMKAQMVIPSERNRKIIIPHHIDT
ncbi:hypothetical protein [Bosea sp. UC22_33]|uniref:hypothetical protein n=1 Tax=Bosea sp. UC22_33 TaxID=3350165 RepID=UPI00366BAB9A